MNILFLSEIEHPDRWIPQLSKLLPLDRFFTHDQFDPAAIDIVLVAKPKTGIIGQLKNVKLVQSLFMGVDGLLADPTFPRDKPLSRLIDPGMVAAMVESVVAHVLDYHRQHYRYRADQSQRKWNRLPQFMTFERTVGLLGLGELGTEAAKMLRTLGFTVAGWKRRPAEIPGIEVFSGAAGVDAMLAKSNVVVCLLPLTPDTKGVLNAKAFATMPKGGAIINVARGGHVVVPDLIAALGSGQLAHAYLDVFDKEPLPEDSPLWAHPGVTITPHTAALTEPRTAMAKVTENIERIRAGQQASNLVDFGAGY
jgi:glyoxylate/hydroxypyruvate reductase A